MMRAMIAAALLAVALTGCGGEDATVQGTVTLDGQPLSRGTVSFIPEAGGAGATATIRADGTFTARTAGADGLKPGEYAVSVQAREEPQPDPNGRPPSPGKLITPPQYQSGATSGLRATIESGDNTLELELRSDAA